MSIIFSNPDESLPLVAKDSEVVRRNHDLTVQLSSRKDRLSWLTGFINENLVLGKVSASLDSSGSFCA